MHVHTHMHMCTHMQYVHIQCTYAHTYKQSTYVTGSGKIDHVGTRIKISLIA